MNGTSTAATSINTGSGNDTVAILSTGGPLFLNTSDGNDTVNIQSIGAYATVNQGNGSDIVTVGSKAPASGGLLSGIVGLLSIVGGPGTMSLTIDDSADTAGADWTLSNSLLTGFVTGSSIFYSGLQSLTLNLGSGGNTLTISGTGANTTTVSTGNGADVVNVLATTGPLTLSLGAGNDVVNLGSAAPGWVG